MSPSYRKTEPVLQVEGITKRFPGVVANDNVTLTLHKGEILALLGENGAGKSTLMNIIYGLYYPDDGTVRVKGQSYRFASPREAIRAGIGMVHQHFQLIPVMTVAENVILGEEQTVSNYLVKMRSSARQTQTMPAVSTGRAAVPPVQPDTVSYRLLKGGWSILWRIFIPFLVVAGVLLIGQGALLFLM